jgi:hypothetical protein
MILCGKWRDRDGKRYFVRDKPEHWHGWRIKPLPRPIERRVYTSGQAAIWLMNSNGTSLSSAVLVGGANGSSWHVLTG